ncbi:TPA: replication initiation protein [Klebsiella aerogenes]
MDKQKKHALENYVATSPERAIGERWITMSNALIRAGHGLTLAEKRIVAMALSTIDSTKAQTWGMEPPVTRITASDFADTFGVSMDTAYDQLQASAKVLYNRSITFYEAAHRRNGKPLPPTKTQMRWVGSAKYHEGEGFVELAWWGPLMKHLMGLKRQFTSYQLQQASALRSAYSWKLLELLQRFEKNGWAEYSVDDFCESMEATEKQRENFAAVRRKIIEPAVKELTEKDGWLIDWKPIKKGRKVDKLRFEFKRDPQGRLL